MKNILAAAMIAASLLSAEAQQVQTQFAQPNTRNWLLLGQGPIQLQPVGENIEYAISAAKPNAATGQVMNGAVPLVIPQQTNVWVRALNNAGSGGVVWQGQPSGVVPILIDPITTCQTYVNNVLNGQLYVTGNIGQTAIGCALTYVLPKMGSFNGNTWQPNLGNIQINASQITSLPPPTLTTGGGVRALNPVAHQFLNGINIDGTLSTAQPQANDIAGLSPSATIDATNAANIASGILSPGRLPVASSVAVGGVYGGMAPVNQFLVGYVSGVPQYAGVSVNNISGLAPSATIDTTNFANITHGTIASSQLPTPTTSLIGGVKASLTQAHQYIMGIGTDGSVSVGLISGSDVTNGLGFTPMANTMAAVTSALGYTPLPNTSAAITGTLGYVPAHPGANGDISNLTGLVAPLSIAQSASGQATGVKATGTDSSVNVFLVPKGSGAIIGNVPDNTATGGNARGVNSIDWQTARAAATQVASGAASTIVGGTQNTASGLYSTVVGGTNNTADGTSSLAAGTFAATKGRYGSSCFASGAMLVAGDAQTCTSVLHGSSTNTTPVRLTSDGASAGGANCINLPDTDAVEMTMTLVGLSRSNVGSAGAIDIKALMSRGTGASTTNVLVQNPGSFSGTGVGASGVSLSLSADTTNGCLAASVTPPTSDNWYWVLKVQYDEVQ